MRLTLVFCGLAKEKLFLRELHCMAAHAQEVDTGREMADVDFALSIDACGLDRHAVGIVNLDIMHTVHANNANLVVGRVGV